MERDASSSDGFEDLVPPPDPSATRRVGLIGFGLVGLAALLGVAAGAEGMATVRLWLVGLGTATAGYAVSRRPGLPQVWLIAAASALLAGGLPNFGPVHWPRLNFVGVPDHWDSAQFMLRVLGFVAAAGAGIAALSYVWRLRVVSAAILFHFFGIFLATTSPSTQGSSPYWITEQIFNKVYMPYLQFVYLRNAYHFYSPEPGPASLLCFLIKTEVGKEEVNGITRPKYERRWVVCPIRPNDIKDPLGVSYFRRLSITEQVSAPGGNPNGLEVNEMRQRRVMAAYEEAPGVEQRIPFNPYETLDTQYRMPSLMTTRYLLPSYTQHIIYEESPDTETMAKSTVLVYLLTHRTMNVQDAHHNVAPYAPSTYRTFYLGEYDTHGKLVDPRDPMLYWLVPIYPKNVGLQTDPNPDLYEDFLSRHAGKKFDWSSLR